jgi:hypothetical protein
MLLVLLGIIGDAVLMGAGAICGGVGARSILYTSPNVTDGLAENPREFLVSIGEEILWVAPTCWAGLIGASKRVGEEVATSDRWPGGGGGGGAGAIKGSSNPMRWWGTWFNGEDSVTGVRSFPPLDPTAGV